MRLILHSHLGSRVRLDIDGDCLQDRLRSEMQLDGELVFTVRPSEPRRLTAAQVRGADA